MKLTDFAVNRFSQFGEDGCIAHIFDLIGEGSGVCVDFGAGDGVSCSNTARLWRSDLWSAVLVEADPERFGFLEATAEGHDAICEQTLVAPLGPDSIDAILRQHGIDAVDFMSIDIDGDDYAILAFLQVMPRVICIEFNPTVPPHISLRQSAVGGTFGASLRSIIDLAFTKGYRFVGATYCNAFLVQDSEAGPFDGYETDPMVLFPPESYTYAVTDFAGKVVLTGQPLPWGARAAYVPELIGVPTYPVSDSVDQLTRGFEAEWGPALRLTPTDLAATTVTLSHDKLRSILGEAPGLVCVDLSNDAPGTEEGLVRVAAGCGYAAIRAGRVLGLMREEGPS